MHIAINDFYRTDIEASILALLMFNKESADSIPELSVEWFAPKKNQIIFLACKAVVDQGIIVDYQTVMGEINKRDDWARDVDQEYVEKIASEVYGAPFKFDDYVRILREQWLKRKVITTSEQIKNLVGKPDYSADDIISEINNLVQGLEIPNTGDKSKLLFDCMADAYKRIDARNEAFSKGLPVEDGIKTGFIELDNKLSYVGNTDLVLIGARPSMGKTTFAQCLIQEVGINQKLPVLFMSAEMSNDDISDRMYSGLGEVPLANIRSGNTEPYVTQLWSAVELVKTSRIVVNDMSKPTVFDVKREARRVVAKFGTIGAIFIDYLQIMKSHVKSDREDIKIGEISKELKAIAKEFKCPVFALSQLNRNLENRPKNDRRPVNSDLRESGSLEQDADIIIMLYRDEVYNKETKYKGVAEAIITKCRNGSLGTAYLASKLSICRFNDLHPEYWQELQGGLA